MRSPLETDQTEVTRRYPADVPRSAPPESVLHGADDGSGTGVRGAHRSRERGERHGPGWFAVGVLLTSAVAFAGYSVFQVSDLKRQLEGTLSAVRLDVQQLDAGIRYDSRRRHLMLGIRDEIMRSNPKASLGEAYEYAQLLVTASEKYPAIDPLLFLAIGIVESGYDPMATSRASAKGLYQIWPATGRLLARALHWEYRDDMLYDAKVNTEMAALYLDVLLSTYNDEKLVLAEYNGGPINAGYLRAGSERAAAETRDYVGKVTATREALKRKFGEGIELASAAMHRDVSRQGKTLGEEGTASAGSGMASAGE